MCVFGDTESGQWSVTKEFGRSLVFVEVLGVGGIVAVAGWPEPNSRSHQSASSAYRTLARNDAKISRTLAGNFLSTLTSPFASHFYLSRPQLLLHAPVMESSRIFVRGLPPKFTEDDVRKHFAKYPVTDVKFFPHRRIGYVGYKTPEDAAKAVKYFNKTFIRMTRIFVEVARPVS